MAGLGDEPTSKHVLVDDQVNGQPFKVYGKPGSLLGWRTVRAEGDSVLVEVNGTILTGEQLAQGWVDTDEHCYEAWARGIKLRTPDRWLPTEQAALREARTHVDSAYNAYTVSRDLQENPDRQPLSAEMQLGVAVLIAVDRLLSVVENADGQAPE
jgi:hypothetical protein